MASDRVEKGREETADYTYMVVSRTERVARWLLGVAAVLTVAFVTFVVVGVGGGWVYGFFTRAVYNAVLVLAVATIVLRAVAVRRERAAWLLLGGALLVWTVADIYFSLFVQDLDPIPIPSVADGLWLGFYPPAYVAVVLLVRSRLSGLRRGMWLDGVIGAFAVAAVCSEAVVQQVLASGLGGSVWQVATTLAYPLGDLVLLSITTLVLALNGWRLDWTWRLLGGGFLAFAVADAVYFWQTANDAYQAGGPVDIGWLLMALLYAAAALRPSPARHQSRSDGQRALVVPTAFGLVGLGLLVYGNLASINTPALVLATLCVLGVIARMALTFAQSRQESLSDALTGLPNRRRLARDLRERAPHARVERPLGVVIFDLNGFKAYNDRFGHPAGDALLIRLSHRLQAALAGDGIAYRMGGDEFCVLLAPARTSLDELVARCLAALCERGEGFGIDAAHGLVRLPDDGADVEDALGLADQRMYALKHGGRVPTERQTTDALVAMLTERHPDLGDHADGVAELAGATGRRLGMSDDELHELDLAARLHDIGKTAVPDAILRKPGSLDADEWELMRRHPAAGERILRAAPALAGVARIVRSTHERVDGQGYPDQLTGDQTPLGARIVAVCDAFDAIISQRPYATRRTPVQAARELRRCAGTQFDSAVVDAFLLELDARTIQPAGARSPDVATAR
jgi:two-component system cell cycle response regulator